MLSWVCLFACSGTFELGSSVSGVAAAHSHRTVIGDPGLRSASANVSSAAEGEWTPPLQVF